MRILIVTYSYLPVLGGLQAAVHGLATSLAAAGHTIHIVANRHPRRLPAAETMDGLPVHRWVFETPAFTGLIGGRRFKSYVASFYYRSSTRRRIIDYIDRFEPDLVNVHFPAGQTPFILAAHERSPFRLAVSLHGEDVERWFVDQPGRRVSAERQRKNEPRQLADLRRLLRVADLVTACSASLLEKARLLEPLINSKSHVLHNGVDLARFASAGIIPRQHPYVLAYGRLVEKKGFDLLLEAFAEVAGTYPETDLIIAGSGELRGDLTAMVARLGLTGRAHLVGEADAAGIVSLLNGALFVVIPSRREPFGIAALEAMAAGKAILATRVGGLPEFIGDTGNQLVEPGVEGLAAGLRAFLSQPDALPRIGQENRRRALEFSWDRVARRFLELLRSSSI